MEAEIKLADEYKDRIIGLESQAHQILRAREIVSNDNRPPARLSGTSANTAGSQHSNLSFKLPKLMIEKFNGDIRLWQEFWSQYETAINNNTALNLHT